MPQINALLSSANAREPSLRLRLRRDTRAAHARLDAHPTMLAYAEGNLAGSQFQRIVGRLLSFWSAAQPDGRALCAGYHALLARYREALAADAGLARHATAPLAVRYDEIAYFYLLLGSSHGARHMLQHSPASHEPHHLTLLAEQGPPLWRRFVRRDLGAVTGARSARVLTDAVRMFAALHDQIDREESP